MTKNYSDQHLGLEIKYLTFPIFESSGRAPTLVDPTTLCPIVNKSVAILHQCNQELAAKIFSHFAFDSKSEIVNQVGHVRTNFKETLFTDFKVRR